MFQEGKTIYHAGIFLHETETVISDGIHRIFVNCAVDDGSDIAELMQYFKKSTGKNNKFPKLSDRTSKQCGALLRKDGAAAGEGPELFHGGYYGAVRRTAGNRAAGG